MTTLAEQLRQLRLDKGLSVPDAATRAQLHQQTVAHIESGNGAFSSAAALAKGYGARVAVKGFAPSRKLDLKALSERTDLAPATCKDAVAFLNSPAHGLVDPQLETLEAVLSALGGSFVLHIR